MAKFKDSVAATKRILLADNDPTFLRQRKAFLEKEGYRVFPAASAVEARRVLKQGGIDLAILDVRLEDNRNEKDISGLLLAKETDRAIPKIMLTSFPTYEAVRESLGASLDELPPAVDFVAKQEGPDALLRAVRKALQNSERSFRATQDEIAEQLNEDYRRARKEARIHYWVNLIASLIFAIPIIIGAFLVLTKERAGAGAVPVIAGVVMEVVHYLFASRLNVAHRRVDRYHEELLQTKRLENLLAACRELGNEQERERCTRSIIETTAKSWIGGPKTPLDEPERKAGKPRNKAAATQEVKE